MRILITGIKGQVGDALMRQLTSHKIIGISRQDCDLTKPDQIEKLIDFQKPDLIINPAAYTKVDQAEDEPELAFLINRDAPRVIAEKAKQHNIPFIHFSTDYVFDGKRDNAYTEDDLTNPLGIYGLSKLAGEHAIQEVGGLSYIFRTSWVYSNIGHNFYLTIKKLIQKQDSLRVINDQFGVPNSNLFLAEQISKIIPNLNKKNIGIYHLVCEGSCSWHTFAKAIASKNNKDYDLKFIHSILTNDFPAKALRPKNSILCNDKVKKTFGLSFNSWQEYLQNL